ncbi:MAG: hypothetical protein D6675_03840 [Gemmatimonadetes bacterium]|nr:MAG: hypothetical protein D6675_03840 [Gemmatimonadota bacterium]
MIKVIKYEFHDIFRSKWLIAYLLFFLMVTDTLFRFGGGGNRVILSLMNLVIFVIPLISILFGTMYLYHSQEFIKLLLSHPIHRRSLFAGMYLGLAIPLSLSFWLGVSIPFAYHDDGSNLMALGMLLMSGVFLTLIFTALAFLTAAILSDKTKGFGVAILVWLFFVVIYDGLILLTVFIFADYPLEQPLIILSLFNPIDLARILMLLSLDISALMGYTGAVFNKFLGSTWGMALSIFCLALWSILPYIAASRQFQDEDF